MRRKTFGKRSKSNGLCNIRKFKAFALPDPWTGKIKRRIRKVLCKECCKKKHILFLPFIHKYLYKNSCFMWSVWCILVKKPHTFYSKDAKFNDGNSIPLELGERIRLRCNFKGNPPPKVVWYKNEKLINPEEDIGVNGQMWKLKIINKR